MEKSGDSNCAKISKPCYFMFFLLAYFFLKYIHIFFTIYKKTKLKDRITPHVGMGKAGKRKEMVKDWCGASCVWKSKCE